MSEGRVQEPAPALAETLRAIERRLARLEARLALESLDDTDDLAREAVPRAVGAVGADDGAGTDEPAAEQDLEFVVGQNWLASVGVLVLTCGVGFALLLPLAGLPPFVPSLAGGAVALVLLALAFRWHTTFTLVAGYFRGAGMVLLYFSVLRLFFFGAEPVLSVDRVAGQLLLLVVVAANVAIALQRQAAWLTALALLTGFVSVVAVGTPSVVFVGVSVLLAIGAWAALTRGWPWLQLFLIPAGYITHLLWLINRPWQGRSVELASRPAAGFYVVLAFVLINAMASLLRRNRDVEDPAAIVAVLLNSGLGYTLFVLATMGGAPAHFGPAHLAASVVFLGLAITFWKRVRSQITTFFYAMTGYLALSMALVKLVPVPELFLWLSLQSLLVVGTALWFRSKLIVVGNFFVFVGIVAAYMVVAAKSESGISIGLGVVALLTARILRWQQERLDLRTELMRNAYLASGFVIFPYATYHLVANAWVPVSWVAVAVGYYVMNLVVHSPKYRWMGHLTLLLTAFYMVVVGIFQLGPAYRIASFLLLGTVLLIVSLIFTMVRARRRERLEDQR
ncbi:MAG: DUF2339 domain-containing protein [Gemmatimonadaceae bacterium]|nr:DUF2339 domain-containing protein [Gemmatimonadaceae bacterium]